MSMRESALYVIANRTTLMIDEGGVAYTLTSRDYKDPLIVFIPEGGGVQHIERPVTQSLRETDKDGNKQT